MLPGMTSAMLVAIGEDGVKTMEDFAGYAVDDLVGWRERKEGQTQNFPGILTSFDITRADAETMVLTARVQAGWIDKANLVTENPAESENPAENENIDNLNADIL